MTRAQIGALAVIVAALAGGGWWLFGRAAGAASLTVPAAHLTVRWRGTYRGEMTLPARLNWCPGTRRGILEAISGDSGAAIVLYERDSLSSGPHGVVSPDQAASIQPPGSTIVMRWMRFERDTTVTGFRSQGGTVRISLARGLASGDLSARMQAAAKSDTLTLQGVFRDVPVVTTAAGCT